MTKTIDKAIDALRKLPEPVQERIGARVLDAVARHKQLNAELAEAEARLDAGEGIPAQDVIAELKDRQKHYDA